MSDSPLKARDDAEPTQTKDCAFCGQPLPEGRNVYCDRICGIRDKDNNDEW